MLRSFPLAHPETGITRQVLSDAPELMTVRFVFEEGAEVRLHSHPHVQASYIVSGHFRFTVSGETFEVGPGNSFAIPSEAEHGCSCLSPGEIVDSFTPRREDFLWQCPENECRASPKGG